MGKTSLLLFVALAAVGAAFAADSALPPAGASQQATNKAVAARVFEEIFNQGKFQVADEIYASDFVNHGLHRNADLQEDQAAVRAEKKAFPDLKMTVELMVAEGDLVTVVWTFRGTNTAAGYGLPPTGARIELRGITVWRIVDGKIREEWTSFDELQAARQFMTQLKWPLLGLLAAGVILVWILCRVILRLRLTRLPKATSQAT
ncbi:MAG: ester cyclase [Candidatus Sulfotelmatobacter sp.]